MYVCGSKYDGGSYGGALFLSEDGGASWVDISARLNGGLPSTLLAVAVDPSTAQRAYVVEPSDGLYLTDDAGASWVRKTLMGNLSEVSVDPTNPSRVYVVGERWIWTSGDAGLTWSLRTEAFRGCAEQLHVARDAPTYLYLATNAGLYRSTDAGSTWFPAHDGIHGSTVTALAVAPSRPSTVYAAAEELGVYLSGDSGTTFETRSPPPFCSDIHDLLVHPTDPATVLALEGDS